MSLGRNLIYLNE
jgi:hypothetical protein